MKKLEQFDKCLVGYGAGSLIWMHQEKLKTSLGFEAASPPQSKWEVEMGEIYGSEQEDVSKRASRLKLMTSGIIQLDRAYPCLVEIQRGMTIHSLDGLPVGKVSAVVRTSSSQQATDILLDRLPGVQGYWLLPAAWILELEGQSLRLSVSASAVEALPPWHMPSQ